MTKEEALMTIQAIPESFWEKLSDAENEAVEMAVKALKGQRWIPCSERLPVGDKFKFEADGVIYYKHVLTSTHDQEAPICVGWYDQDCEAWYDLEGFPYHPVAWMQLPESYKEC